MCVVCLGRLINKMVTYQFGVVDYHMLQMIVDTLSMCIENVIEWEDKLKCIASNEHKIGNKGRRWAYPKTTRFPVKSWFWLIDGWCVVFTMRAQI